MKSVIIFVLMPEYVCKILEDYSNLILAVMSDDDSDPLWHRFYRIQMAQYLLGQKNLQFDLEPVQIVYNLIQQNWAALKEYMDNSLLPVKNFDNVFKMISIDFPVDRFTITNVAESF